MPLMQCPDCGRDVSPRAYHCVHCGRPHPGWTRKSTVGVILTAVLFFGLAGSALFLTKRCRREREKCHKAEKAMRAPERARTAESTPAPLPDKQDK